MNNFDMVKLAQSYLGAGGSTFRKWAGLGSGQPWCNAFVSYLFWKSGNGKLYCNGAKETYCPHSIKWCYDNLALLPIYLVMPGDVIYFDWQPNGTPDHVGIVEERESDLAVKSIEGNTSGSQVARKTRSEADVQGVFRPHFKPTGWSSTKKLKVDGYLGYNSVAVMQRVLGVKIDGILGQETVKALQKKAGIKQDGWWGPKTSKAVQKLIGTKEDGYFGPKSVKALQTWLNEKNVKKKAEPDPLQPWYDALKTQYEYSKDQKYNWVTPTIASSRKEGTCVTFPAVAMQRLGILPSKGYLYINDSGKLTGRSSSYAKAHPEIFEILYPGKTIKELGSKIKKGDIVCFKKPNDHIMVYKGKNGSGDPIFDTMGHTRGLNIKYLFYANRKIDMIIRLKKIK